MHVNEERLCVKTQTCTHTRTVPAHSDKDANTLTDKKSGNSQKYPQLRMHFTISFYSLLSRFTITQPTGVINISNVKNYANTLPRCGGKQLCSFNTLLQPLRRNPFLICQCSTKTNILSTSCTLAFTLTHKQTSGVARQTKKQHNHCFQGKPISGNNTHISTSHT